MWNWQLPDWPNFIYDSSLLVPLERRFLLQVGSGIGLLRHLDKDERNRFVVEVLSSEGLESSKIEGEILQRESLQSSIRRHFGIHDDAKEVSDKEVGMARALCAVYDSFDVPLTHEMLWQWHDMLFSGWSRLEDRGRYRTHLEPMQIVSGRLPSKIYLEAPASKDVHREMTLFLKWFNDSRSSVSILERAGLVHVYFESIHPFEDGNGRIGRMLVEKVLSQGIGQPSLIAVSKTIEMHKRNYYEQLGACNKTLRVQPWIVFLQK